MINFFKNLKKSTHGAAAIEFALILPIIIVFTFGVFEFCRVAFTQTILSYSAAQASRYAMVNIDQNNVGDAAYLTAKSSEIEDFAEESFILIEPARVSSFVVVLVPAALTTTVNVSIAYDYTTFIPMLPDMDFTLTADSDSFLVRSTLLTP